MTQVNKKCPECEHDFKCNGWDGIDAHWRSKHAHVMPYEEAWLLISAGKYKRKKMPHEDVNQAAARTIREATERLVCFRSGHVNGHLHWGRKVHLCHLVSKFAHIVARLSDTKKRIYTLHQLAKAMLPT